MKYKIALIIVLTIIYIGLFWGIPTIILSVTNNIKNYFFIVMWLHIIVGVCLGICILIAYLLCKAGY